MTKRASPKRYAEWTALLQGPLSDETALLLRQGSLKEKELSTALFNRISDYVVEEFNRAAAAVQAESGEIIFALKGFSAVLSRLLFFTQLGFIREEHRTALYNSLQTATGELIRNVMERFTPQDANVLFELNVLRRKTGASNE